MNNNMPLISIIMPSYNHEKFVGEAIESILKQTYTNWELIITDDGSSDNTADVIKKYDDKRIHSYFFSKNQGAAIASQYCLSKIHGEYIALLNSDDLWNEKKLEIQMKFLLNNPEYVAVFSDAQFVDEAGCTLSINEYRWADIFSVKNKSQGEWLNHFFFRGNCLCHPSILIKSSYYTADKLKEALRQLPDFYMWVGLVKKAKIYVLPEKLVRFRILSHNKNTSSVTPTNKIRNINELYFIYGDFFNDVPNDIFREGFSSLFKCSKAIYDDELLKFEKIFLYFRPHGELSVLCNLIGEKKMFDALLNEENEKLLRKYYSFSFKDFQKMTGEIDLLFVKNDVEIVNLAFKRKIQKYIPNWGISFIKRLLPNKIINIVK